MISNCCGAPIWQPDPITGHGHCNECGEHCTPEKKENDMKEKRTVRKELLLTPTEHAQMSAAAKQAGLSLSAWVVMAANKWLEIERANNEINRANDPDWWMKKLGVKNAGS